MYKFHTTEDRSNLMKRIRSTDTAPEVNLRKKLWALGIRYRKNFRALPGKPDIAITTRKIAIFIDGEFWHGYNWSAKKEKIKSNRDYWIPKIEKTICRDLVTNKVLEENGWIVIRLWQHEIAKDIDKCLDQIIQAIRSRHHENHL